MPKPAAKPHTIKPTVRNGKLVCGHRGCGGALVGWRTDYTGRWIGPKSHTGR